MENSVTEKKKKKQTPPLNRRDKVACCFCSEEVWFHYRHLQCQLELDLLDTAPRLKKKKTPPTTKKDTVKLPQPNWFFRAAGKQCQVAGLGLCILHVKY